MGVLFGALKIADKFDLGKGVAFIGTEVEISRAWFLGYIDQVCEPKVLDLPRAIPVARVVPFAVKALLRDTQVKVFWYHSRVDVDRSVLVESGNIESSVIHNVIKIDSDTEAVCGFDQFQQLCLCAVSRTHRVTLILASKIKRIPQIVADREPTTSFGGRRQPERRIARFCQFGHFTSNLCPVRIEILEHRLAK